MKMKTKSNGIQIAYNWHDLSKLPDQYLAALLRLTISTLSEDAKDFIQFKFKL